jgi:hypothetical protein
LISIRREGAGGKCPEPVTQPQDPLHMLQSMASMGLPTKKLGPSSSLFSSLIAADGDFFDNLHPANAYAANATP